ncbi:MAG: hypothetical protein LBK02_07660 [Treponema sp.]|jgi:hypothetical protein|nr:hypothetical protein [Treponema sp.]
MDNMNKAILIFILFICQGIYAENLDGAAIEVLKNIPEDNGYVDYGTSEGITIYADQPKPEYPPESIEANILTKLNGFSSDREQFIKEDLLKSTGFSRTADIKFRESNGTEKTLSILHGIFHTIIPRTVPMKPFFEVEQIRLPKGTVFNFEVIFYNSTFKDVSVEVRKVMELEYMYQMEFRHGVLGKNDNLNYYTEENIAKFENLALSLPDTPQSIKDLKDRYLHDYVPGIKTALERFQTPGENYLRAIENLNGHFEFGGKK